MNKTTWFKQKNTSSNSFAALKNLVYHLNVPINDFTIEETLQEHPDSNSALALCDALTEWKINNWGVHTTQEKLPEVTLPALAVMTNNSFVMLSELNNNQVRYIDPSKGWITETLEEFSKKWDGIILMATANETSGEKEYALNRKKEILNKLRIPFIITALLALVTVSIIAGFFNHSAEITTWLPLILAKSVGIGLGFLLIIEQINKHNPIINKICGFSPKISCEEVTKSPAGTLFGWLSMSEIGLFYFVSGFLTLALSLFSLEIQTVLVFLAILNLMTLPYTLFSISYQATVVKKWCPLCLGVAILFWAEFIIFISSLSFKIPPITLNAISIILWGFLLPIIIWTIFKPSVISRYQIPSLKKALALFKSEPKIFEALLSQEQPVSTKQLTGDIILGDPNSHINIIMITSPFCGYCTPAFNELEKLLNEFPEGVKVLIRILDQGKRDVSKQFISLALSDNPEMAKQALHAWYIQKETQNSQDWLKQFSTKQASSETISKLLDEIANWCDANKVSGTPTFFINGRKLPMILKIGDIKYYLRELFENIESK